MTPRRLALVLVLALIAAFAALADDTKGRARVVAFTAFGTPTRLTVVGRVVTDPPPPRGRGLVATVWTHLDVLESDEVAGARVLLDIDGARVETTTDRDGLFSIDVTPARDTFAVGELTYDVRLVDDDRAHQGTAIVVDDGPGIAVISDFDDTVVNTFVRDKPRMLAQVLMSDARGLEIVPGAPEAYRLARDAGARGFFYVSGSPLALYERIASVLDDHGLPRGPIFLKNLGEDALFAHEEYKLARIEAIFTRFPQLHFVLVGDSGERDPEIYAELRRRHGERVGAILIRRAPMTDIDVGRFDGMFVVDDHVKKPALLASLVVASARRQARLLREHTSTRE